MQYKTGHLSIALLETNFLAPESEKIKIFINTVDIL